MWTSAVDSASAIVPAQNIPWLLKFHTHTNQQRQERRTDGPMVETRIARVPYFTTSKLSDHSLSVPCRQPTGWSRVKPSQPIQLSHGRAHSFFRHCRWRGVSGAVVVCREPLQVDALNNFRPALRNAGAGGVCPAWRNIRVQGVPRQKKRSSAPLSAGAARGGNRGVKINASSTNKPAPQPAERPVRSAGDGARVGRPGQLGRARAWDCRLRPAWAQGCIGQE